MSRPCEKLGCLQLRWQSWAPWSAEPDKRGFGAICLIHFGCHSSQALFLTADQQEGPDTVDYSNYSLRQILRGSWLRAHLPAPLLLQYSNKTQDGIPQPLLSTQCDSATVCIQFPSSTRMSVLRHHWNGHWVCSRTPSKPSGLLNLPLQWGWVSSLSKDTIPAHQLCDGRVCERLMAEQQLLSRTHGAGVPTLTPAFPVPCDGETQSMIGGTL